MSRERLARALQNRTPGLSYSRAKRAVEAGQVRVDGVPIADPGAWVEASAVIEWVAGAAPTGPAVELVHVDADLVVAVKPAGLLTQPTTARERDTLLGRVSLALARRRGRRGYLAIVHRLDKETSGLVALAASRRGLEGLQAQLADHSLGRVYTAVVEGDLAVDDGFFDTPLVGDGTHRRRWIATAGERGRPAVTHFRVRERFGSATLVEVRLETGRTHQIRIHFAAAGHPVVGDPVYRPRGLGAPAIEFPRQALHAGELALCHPADDRPLRFTAPWPEDLCQLVATLRGPRGRAKARGSAPLSRRID